MKWFSISLSSCPLSPVDTGRPEAPEAAGGGDAAPLLLLPPATAVAAPLTVLVELMVRRRREEQRSASSRASIQHLPAALFGALQVGEREYSQHSASILLKANLTKLHQCRG